MAEGQATDPHPSQGCSVGQQFFFFWFVGSISPLLGSFVVGHGSILTGEISPLNIVPISSFLASFSFLFHPYSSSLLLLNHSRLSLLYPPFSPPPPRFHLPCIPSASVTLFAHTTFACHPSRLILSPFLITLYISCLPKPFANTMESSSWPIGFTESSSHQRKLRRPNSSSPRPVWPMSRSIPRS